MFGRPLLVWLILALLLFNIYGSVSGLIQVFSGHAIYATSTLIISCISSVLAAALIPLILMRHGLTRVLSWLMFAILAGNQAIAFMRHSPNSEFEIGEGQQVLLIGIFTVAMIAIYALPSLYFQYSKYLKGTVA